MNTRQLQEILEKHKKWMNEEDEGERANLQRAGLQGADLQGANLREANLRGADLQGANLREANLQGANLQGVDLQGAYLQGANLWGANLREADLRGANLRGAELDFSCWPLWCGSFDVKVDKQIAAQLAYHFCRLDCDDPEYIAARNAIVDFANQFHRVEECGRLNKREERDMNTRQLQEILEKHKKWMNEEDEGERANLQRAGLQGADLQGAGLQGADLQRANLWETDLRGANLQRADLQGAYLQGANLWGADLQGANLWRANLQGANLWRADLRGAELDFSCWPLWCGSFDVKVDKQIAAQLAYHFCRLDCDDPEYIAARNAIVDFANQFHRVEECGRLNKREE